MTVPEDQERKRFELQKRRHRLQNDRMIVWSARSGLVLLAGGIIAVLSTFAGIRVDPATVVIVIISFIAVMSIGQAAEGIRSTGALFETVRQVKREVTWRTTFKALLEDPMQAMMSADLLMSVALLQAMAIADLVVAGRHPDATLAALPSVLWIAWTALRFDPEKPLLKPEEGKQDPTLYLIFLLILVSNLAISSLPLVDGLGGGIARLAISLVMAAIITLTMMVSFVFLEDVFDLSLRILPCRGRIRSMSAGMRRVVAAMEAMTYAEMLLVVSGTLVFAPLVFQLYEAFPSFLVFVAYDVVVAGPVLISAILALGHLKVSTLFFIQRLGILYAIVVILIVNAATLGVYALTWVATQVYVHLFGPLGRFFFPDFVFLYRETAPRDLPLAEMALGVAVTCMGLLAISWFIIVVRKGAWREMTYVGGSTLAILIGATWGEVIGQRVHDGLPILRQVHPFILTLLVPAVSGILTKELEEVMQTNDAAGTCPSCSAPAIRDEQRFCIECGANMSGVGGAADPPRT